VQLARLTMHTVSQPSVPSLLSASIEISLPISPHQVLFFSHRGDTGYVNLSQFGPQADSLIAMNTNRRTRSRAKEWIVVSRSIVLAGWLAPQGETRT